MVLLALGTWQVIRLSEKHHLIQTIQARVAEGPVDLPYQSPLNLEQWQYRQVVLHGRFLYDEEALLYTGPKEINGTIGYNLLTPMQLTGGGTVLVDRGWVPYKQKNLKDRPETQVAGDVTVIGMIHASEKPGMFTPKNDPDRHIWFWIDVPRMLGNISLDNPVAHYYIRALRQPDMHGLPMPGEATVHYRNDHLQYAITWYSLAVILIIVYGAFRLQVLAANTKD